MITIENIVPPSDDQWEAVIRGCRHPFESYSKSDSGWGRSYDWIDNDHQVVKVTDHFDIGEADMALMQRLSNAGDDHGKFMRMLTVMVDITAPVYWLAELDTYKVSTVRNSSSLMHTAMKNPYTIRNFSVQGELYEILDPVREAKAHPLIYPENGKDDFKIYSLGDREYEVYSNGRVVSRAYECKHTADNRTRHFQEFEIKPNQGPDGYYRINLGGKRFREKWLLHRLVAEVWLKDTYAPGLEINHKDGNKGNNSVQNLEWVTREENTKHKFEFLGSGRDLHSDYLSWKKSTKYSQRVKESIDLMHSLGASYAEIQEIHDLSKMTIGNIINGKKCENAELFQLAQYWEDILTDLNELRDLYLQTKDDAYFFLLRQKMPMSYNYHITWSANYQVLRRIYHSRKNHKLMEWETFRAWITTLPHANLIIGETDGNKD